MNLFTSLILIATSSIAFAADEVRKVGDADEMPKDGFANFSELQIWATTSSFGGGSANSFVIEGKNIYCSDRMVTSGMPTSELMFFTDSHDGRIRRFLLIPTQNKDHRISVEEDMLVVRCYVPSNKTWQIALKISPWMLPGSIHNLDRREQGGAGQPATRPELESEGNDNHQPESEWRSR